MEHEFIEWWEKIKRIPNVNPRIKDMDEYDAFEYWYRFMHNKDGIPKIKPYLRITELELKPRKDKPAQSIKEKWKRQLEICEYVKSLYRGEIFYNYKHPKLRFTKSGYPMEFDIFIPDKNIAIEYHGEEHFFPINIFGGEKAFKQRVERDNEKRRKCKEK